MNRKTTLASLGLAAVTVSALGVGTALASTHTLAAPSKTSVSRLVGPGNTAVDTPTAGDKPDAAVDTPPTAGDKPDAAVDTPTAGDKPDPASNEPADAPDGPGGYANGNADTQQTGQH